MSKSNKVKQDNTMLLILVIILVVCVAAMLILFYKFFYHGIGDGNKYGDTRLEGIENYPLSSTLSEDITSLYSKDSSVGKTTVNVEGRIIYITVDFVKSIKIETAKSIAIKALDKIGEENLKYYEVQFILTYSGKDENSNFPVFGSKNANSLKVIW